MNCYEDFLSSIGSVKQFSHDEIDRSTKWIACVYSGLWACSIPMPCSFPASLPYSTVRWFSKHFVVCDNNKLYCVLSFLCLQDSISCDSVFKNRFHVMSTYWCTCAVLADDVCTRPYRLLDAYSTPVSTVLLSYCCWCTAVRYAENTSNCYLLYSTAAVCAAAHHFFYPTPVFFCTFCIHLPEGVAFFSHTPPFAGVALCAVEDCAMLCACCYTPWALSRIYFEWWWYCWVPNLNGCAAMFTAATAATAAALFYPRNCVCLWKPPLLFFFFFYLTTAAVFVHIGNTVVGNMFCSHTPPFHVCLSALLRAAPVLAAAMLGCVYGQALSPGLWCSTITDHNSTSAIF